MIIKLTKYQLGLVKKEIERLEEHREHIEDHWRFILTNEEIENLKEVVRTKESFVNNTNY